MTTTLLTATASVATTAAPRYAKQLASHLGRRSEIRELGRHESAGENKGESAGESRGENAGESRGENAGESRGENAGENKGQNKGESAGQNARQSAGESAGESGDIAIVLTVGECRLHSTATALELTATAANDDDLRVVTKVVGSHLERFGQRNELEVTWKFPG